MKIDAECLRATIEKRVKSIESCHFIEAEFGALEKREGRIQAYYEILILIESLQQERPEIDWEKELRNWMVEMDGRYALLTTDYVDRLITDTAKHFYELGLNARKEE